MKKVILATAIAITATSASAGALSDPIVEPIVIIEDTAGSANHDWLVPAMFVLMLVASLARPASGA